MAQQEAARRAAAAQPGGAPQTTAQQAAAQRAAAQQAGRRRRPRAALAAPLDRPATPGSPDPELPRRPRESRPQESRPPESRPPESRPQDSGPWESRPPESGSREIRYSPTVSGPSGPAQPPAFNGAPAWQSASRGDGFDGGTRVPYGGETQSPPGGGTGFGGPGPGLGEDSPQDYLQGSPGYEFGPGTGPLRALNADAALPRGPAPQPANGFGPNGMGFNSPAPAPWPGPGAGPGAGAGAGLAAKPREVFGGETRPPRVAGVPPRPDRRGGYRAGGRDIDDDDDDADLTTTQRLFKEIRTALRLRGWVLKVGIPILAMIPVGIAVVIISGANSTTSTSPSTDSLGFPPANFAAADFTTSAAEAGRGLSQALGPVAADGNDLVAIGDETGSETAHTEFFVSQNAGKTWQLATVEGNPSPGHVPTHIAVGPDGWVAVGPDSIWTSKDGTDWTLSSATGLPTEAGDAINTLTRTPDGFLAAGGNNGAAVVWTSANGTTWQRSTPGLNGTITSSAGTANATVITSRTTAWRSTNDTTWTQVTVPQTDARDAIAGVAQIADGFVVIRPGATASQAIYYTSADGQTWTKSATIATGNGAALTLDNVKGATTGAVLTGSADGFLIAFITSNGTNWTGTDPIATTRQETESGVALTTNNVAVTTGTSPLTDDRRKPLLALVAAQGAATQVTLTGAVRNQLTVAAIAASGGTQVVAGSADGFPAIWTSADGGSSWTRATSAALNRAGIQQLTGVAHGDAGWVAVGRVVSGATAHPVVVTSADGANWTAADIESAFGGGDESATAVAAGTSGYVVTGQQDGNAIAWFSKGLTGWQLVTLPNAAGATISAVTASGGSFAAVGTSNGHPVAWISHNGVSWTSVTIALPAGASSAELGFVAANGDRLVAAGTSVTAGKSEPFAVLSSDGGASWADSDIAVMGSDDATVTGLTAAGSGFTGTGTTGSNVVIWSLRTGTTWTAALPSGRGLAGTGLQELTAITASGSELTAVGFVATAETEQPTIWQSPVRG